MTKIELNINEHVEFELTEYGAKILNGNNLRLALTYPGVIAFQDYKKYKEGDVIKMQLWKVMEEFGEHTSLGLGTFCKNATITFNHQQGVLK